MANRNTESDLVSLSDVSLQEPSDIALSADLEARDMNDLINVALSRLEPPQEEIIVRHFGLNGYQSASLAVIAHDLNLNIGTVRRHYNHGLQKLSRYIPRGLI